MNTSIGKHLTHSHTHTYTYAHTHLGEHPLHSYGYVNIMIPYICTYFIKNIVGKEVLLRILGITGITGCWDYWGLLGLLGLLETTGITGTTGGLQG